MTRRPNPNIPLLLTATVNPQGMVGASFSPDERARMYADALSFYCRELRAEGAVTIVFAENSGACADVRRLLEQEAAPADLRRIEWVDARGEAYDQSRGKGYNEILLISRAVAVSDAIREAGCFFKLTGRLKVLNIRALLAEVSARHVAHFLADCKDHDVYRRLGLPINGHAGECRYWYASTDFYLRMLAPRYTELNDYSRPPYLAEDLMLDVCRRSRGMEGCRDRFRTQARVSGRGAHDLGRGPGFFYSTDNDSFALRFKCALRQLLRWVLPGWRV